MRRFVENQAAAGFLSEEEIVSGSLEYMDHRGGPQIPSPSPERNSPGMHSPACGREQPTRPAVTDRERVNATFEERHVFFV